MELVIKDSGEEVAAEAYEIIAGELARKPDLTIGLSSGRSPLRLYRLLRESRLDFSQAYFFNLDEFVGLGPNQPRSFNRFLREHLLDGLNVPPRNIRLLRGDAQDPASECELYERAVRERGGIDLQILGVGRNGHIAFNEPGSSLGSRTRVKTLEVESIAYYAAHFGHADDVPRFALTMGIGTIMEARRIVVIAHGQEKSEIMRRIVEGPVSSEVPGTALQFHPRTSVLLDGQAASQLARRDYWKWVYQNKWRVGQKD